MGVIQELASELDVGERTLRRAVAQGALRATRSGPRRLRLAPGSVSISEPIGCFFPSFASHYGPSMEFASLSSMARSREAMRMMALTSTS
jgi:excisionase family DNA binding protein